MAKQIKTRQARAQEMYSLVESYETSGLSVGEFCKRSGVKVPTFGYWRRKYLSDSSEVPAAGFVSLVPRQSVEGGIVVEYGDVVIRMGGEVGLDYVVCLVQKLSGVC